jgi:hypothetical protein
MCNLHKPLFTRNINCDRQGFLNLITNPDRDENNEKNTAGLRELSYCCA